MFFRGHCCIQSFVLTIIDSNGNFDECNFTVSEQPLTIVQYPSSSTPSSSSLTTTTTTTDKQTTTTTEKQTTVAVTSSYLYVTTTDGQTVTGSNQEVSNILIDIVSL